MKNILGLDLGTNSIGWALIKVADNGEPESIEGMGSRIIPMGADKNSYEKGESITKNAVRNEKKRARINNKRYKQRRNKLLYVMSVLEMLPSNIIVKHRVRDINGKLTCQLADGFPKAEHLQDIVVVNVKKGSLQSTAYQQYKMKVDSIYNKLESLTDFGKILYQYNQLRGYSGGGNSEKKKDDKPKLDEDKKSLTFVEMCLIKKIEKLDNTFTCKSGINKGKELNYYRVTTIIGDDEYIGETAIQTLNENTEYELQILIKKLKNGEKITFSLPKKTNWRKLLEQTEHTLKDKECYISELILSELIKDNNVKTRNRIILRNRYKEEFDAVWCQQAKYYSILNNCSRDKLELILNYLYPGVSENYSKLKEDGFKYGLYHIIRNQIIYYQRPLKPQTDLINRCSFENDERVTAVSDPIFQEFRCWKQINNLWVSYKEKTRSEVSGKAIYKECKRFLTKEQKVLLFEKLQDVKELDYNSVIKILNVKKDGSAKSEHLEGLHIREKMKGCDTLKLIKNILGANYIHLVENDNEMVSKLWEIIYYEQGNEYDENSLKIRSLIELLNTIINDNTLSKDLAFALAQKLEFPRKYSNLSRKTILNILPLMRCGKYFNENSLSENIKSKFKSIFEIVEDGEIKDNIKSNVIIGINENRSLCQEGGMMEYLALGLLYDSHSNINNILVPTITDYHKIVYQDLKLRNPVVEQIVNEAMQVVKSIWKQYNLDTRSLEIRIELARDLKNSAIERERIAKLQKDNNNINEKIKQRLIEIKQSVTDNNVNIYKLWEQQSKDPIPTFKKSNEPTASEIKLMRQWEDQGCISPYTGKPIPLSKLFDENCYNKEHIIPKARYYDNSNSNIVIVESNVNLEKGDQTAWEYISRQNSVYDIFTIDAYIENVNKYFKGEKRKKLLMAGVPEDPILRKLKETQYISVVVKNELAKIVGSTNIKTSTGEVTSILRSQWGLTKLFMSLTEDRFKRMEIWDRSKVWVKKGFDKDKNRNIYEISNWSKRYDNRHHAIDALVVALTTKRDIDRLNNLNKAMQDWLESNKEKYNLNITEGGTIYDSFFNLPAAKRKLIQIDIPRLRSIKAPIKDLVNQTKVHLETMIVSTKPKDNLKYQIDMITGEQKLKIRDELHESTYYGKSKGRDTKTISISELSIKQINLLISESIKREINAHKGDYQEMSDAFKSDGLLAFNDKRRSIGKCPVYKVKIFKTKDSKSELERLYDNNSKLSVVTGNNYIFVVMKKGNERCFEIVSLYDAVKVALGEFRNNNNINFMDVVKEYVLAKNKADEVLFILRANDIVYVPVDNNDVVLGMNNNELLEWLVNLDNKRDFVSRLFKVVKFTGNDCYFIPNNYAKIINAPKYFSKEERKELKKNHSNKRSIPKDELNYREFGSYDGSMMFIPNEDVIKKLNKETYNKKGIIKIQDKCIKLVSDWLGNVYIDKL